MKERTQADVLKNPCEVCCNIWDDDREEWADVQLQERFKESRAKLCHQPCKATMYSLHFSMLPWKVSSRKRKRSGTEEDSDDEFSDYSDKE
jgi:hypothetical protein